MRGQNSEFNQALPSNKILQKSATCGPTGPNNSAVFKYLRHDYTIVPLNPQFKGDRIPNRVAVFPGKRETNVSFLGISGFWERFQDATL